MDNPKSGECWKLKNSPDYSVLIKYIFFGYVFFERWGITAHLKKGKFLEHFEYSHYVPSHIEMG